MWMTRTYWMTWCFVCASVGLLLNFCYFMFQLCYCWFYHYWTHVYRALEYHCLSLGTNWWEKLYGVRKLPNSYVISRIIHSLFIPYDCVSEGHQLLYLYLYVMGKVFRTYILKSGMMLVYARMLLWDCKDSVIRLTHNQTYIILYWEARRYACLMGTRGWF